MYHWKAKCKTMTVTSIAGLAISLIIWQCAHQREAGLEVFRLFAAESLPLCGMTRRLKADASPRAQLRTCRVDVQSKEHNESSMNRYLVLRRTPDANFRLQSRSRPERGHY